MRIAVLDSPRSSIGRDVDFSLGVFTVDGLGEVSIDDLHEFDVAGNVHWLSKDVRSLVLGYSLEAGCATGSANDGDPSSDVETEVVYVPPHRVGSRTEAELRTIVADMIERGWLLVEDSRIGAAGGHLMFQRSEPLDPALLRSLSFAG